MALVYPTTVCNDRTDTLFALLGISPPKITSKTREWLVRFEQKNMGSGQNKVHLVGKWSK